MRLRGFVLTSIRVWRSELLGILTRRNIFAAALQAKKESEAAGEYTIGRASLAAATEPATDTVEHSPAPAQSLSDELSTGDCTCVCLSACVCVYLCCCTGTVRLHCAYSLSLRGFPSPSSVRSPYSFCAAAAWFVTCEKGWVVAGVCVFLHSS